MDLKGQRIRRSIIKTFIITILVTLPTLLLVHQEPVKNQLPSNIPPPPKVKNSVVVIIDPGNDGSDPGACNGGVKEKDINLSVARIVLRELQNKGIDAHLTREDDRDFVEQGVYSRAAERTDLLKRIEVAQKLKGQVYVSIHVNSGLGSASGAEVYYGPRNPEAMLLAQTLQGELNKVAGMTPRKEKKDRMYLFDHLKIPVVLVETGWICNPAERSKLVNPQYQESLATAITNGINVFTQSLK